jgi:hypothetical protein
MRNIFFLLMVFTLSAVAASWLYPENDTPELVASAVAAGESKVPVENVASLAATPQALDENAPYLILEGAETARVALTTGMESPW